MLKEAKKYYDAGFWIIPTHNKAPYLRGWNRERQTWATIKRELNRGRGVGLLCGKVNGLFCVDVDFIRGGERWFKAFNWSRAVIHKSPNGVHLFYKYDPAFKNSRDKIAPGVEILTDGKQVIIPPTANYNGKPLFSVDLVRLVL